MRCEEVDVEGLAPLISFGYALMLDDTLDARSSGALPDDQFVDVRYADLMADPAAIVLGIYERLDRPASESAAGVATGGAR